jgi:hypothetical protein
MTVRKRVLAGYAAAATAITISAAVWALPAAGQAGTASGPTATGTTAASTSMAAMGMSAAAGTTGTLTRDIAAARIATAKYATNLGRAKADGYKVITPMMPNMGIHFLNPKISGFNLRKPQILVYEHTSSGWQLGALEWVFPAMPKNPPLPNATFGFFPAACHYADGTFVPDENAATCPKKAPHTGAKFFFWHPDLTTLHMWVWYPNRAGLYSSTNPDVAPFNKG